jgi:hypothetical protein
MLLTLHAGSTASRRKVGWSKDAWTCKSMGSKCKAFSDCPKNSFCDMSKGRCRSWGSASDFLQLLQ